ncbi:MAG: radical SAM family heme chaperone HemW [Cyclobacteriaceae bacterium]
MPGLYIHVPFCKQACHYCDFHFTTNLSRQAQMVSAMVREIELQKDYLEDKELTSIYFGGGTPSLLSGTHLETIFDEITKWFRLSADCEITLEANPDDLSLANLKTFLESGINRLSIGIQSFDDKILKFLNRAHDRKMALEALANVRGVGFQNISIDLIYAIPEQNNGILIDNLDASLQFSPEHVSAYALTIEEKTVFGNWLSKKKLVPVDESINASQFELLSESLTKHGYEHYEISNYAKPDKYSRHNSSYWKQEPYLGIGPSAHSYNIRSRQFNVSNNATYLNSIANHEVPFRIEVLTQENKINEYVFTTLRTIWGCDLEKLKTDYSFDLLKESGDYISELTRGNLARIDNGFLKLTNQGKLLADQISLELMVG